MLRHDEGFSLPELLVTMLLMAIVGSMVASLAVSFSRTITRERARMDSTNVAAVGMNEMTRIIRAGTAIRNDYIPGGAEPIFTYAGNERVTLHAGVDTTTATLRPIQVTFTLDATRVLTESRTTPRVGGASEAVWVFTGAGTTTTTRPIARKIVAPSGTEPYLFTYWDASVPAVQLVPPVGGTLSAADLTRIASVEVYLKVQADPTGRADPVVLVNQVGIPNVGLGQLGATP
jgi:prepilin-type N-terminal cleavage/methylation domain-containing protein